MLWETIAPISVSISQTNRIGAINTSILDPMVSISESNRDRPNALLGLGVNGSYFGENLLKSSLNQKETHLRDDGKKRTQIVLFFKRAITEHVHCAVETH